MKPPLQRLMTISWILLCVGGCSKQRPELRMLPHPIIQTHCDTLAEDASALPCQSLANTKWIQGSIDINRMQKQSLDSQFTTATEKLTLEQDAALLEALHQEAKFQTTIRLERLRMQNRARLYRLDNKAFSLPQISLFIHNPFKPL